MCRRAGRRASASRPRPAPRNGGERLRRHGDGTTAAGAADAVDRRCSIGEGNSGTAQLTFHRKLSQAVTGPVTVTIRRRRHGDAGADYTARSGTPLSRPARLPRRSPCRSWRHRRSRRTKPSPWRLRCLGRHIATVRLSGRHERRRRAAGNGRQLAGLRHFQQLGIGLHGAMTVAPAAPAFTDGPSSSIPTAAITSIWSAEIVSHVGDHYVVRNAAWNGDIGSGRQRRSVSSEHRQHGHRSVGLCDHGTPSAGSVADTPGLSVADADSGRGSSVTTIWPSPSRFRRRPRARSRSPTHGQWHGNGRQRLRGTCRHLTFAAGETSRWVHVQGLGRTAVEASETVKAQPVVAERRHHRPRCRDRARSPTTMWRRRRRSHRRCDLRRRQRRGPWPCHLHGEPVGPSTTPVTVSYATVNGTRRRAATMCPVRDSHFRGRRNQRAFRSPRSAMRRRGQRGFTVVLTNRSGPPWPTVRALPPSPTTTWRQPVELPALSISDVSVTEGDPGTGPAASGCSAPRATRSSIRPATPSRSPA